MSDKEFFTFREYMKKEDEGALTASMEDYLEMIYRLAKDTYYTRIHELSSALNVQPPSATKMVQKLAELGLLDYRKYDIITLTQKGQSIGKALIHKHNMIEEFLKLIGVSEGLLEETEKVEHTVGIQTLKCFNDLIRFFDENPDVREKYHRFRDIKDSP